MAPATQTRQGRTSRFPQPTNSSYDPSNRSGTIAAFPTDGSTSFVSATPAPASADAAALARHRARTQARRRQAVSNGLRRFETALPAPITRGLPAFTSALVLSASSLLTGAPSRAGRAAQPRTGAAAVAARHRGGTLAQLGYSGFVWSKLVSLALLAATLFGLYWFQTDDRWYVDTGDVRVVGTYLVNPAVLMQAATVDGWNVFWLRRDELRERLLAHPWVDDVDVDLTVALLAGDAGVRLTVQEAPAIGIWATELGDFLISPHGAALPVQPPTPIGLPRLIDPTFDAAVPGSQIGSAIETSIVASALALIERVSGVTEVRYNSDVGLNFSLPGAPLWVYWGDGSLPEEKLAAIELGRRLVALGDASKPILDVRNPAKPTLR